MKAIVKTQKGVGFLELKDVPEPKPGSGEVLIEVKAAGICGTDVHVKHDNFPYWPPVILGHEFSGEIVELGPDCKYYKIGDRVVGEPHTKHCGYVTCAAPAMFRFVPQNAVPAGELTAVSRNILSCRNSFCTVFRILWIMM